MNSGLEPNFREYSIIWFVPSPVTPLPKEGQLACGLNRAGEEMGWFPVVKVIPGSKTNKTCTICLAVPKDLAMEVRNIRAGGYQDGR